MKIGILALQGAVEPHRKKLAALGVEPQEVRTPADLEELSGIILPGGESTTMIHLLKLNSLWEPLQSFSRHKPTWGVCAGAILLARKVRAPLQESLSAIDIEVERNAYGRQIDSFVANLQPTEEWIDQETLEGVFIRAPRINWQGTSVRSLVKNRDEVVLAEEGHILVSTFHPELTISTKIHRYFIEKCRPNHG